MLMEMARMSCDDGLVMQLHAGAWRDHNMAVAERYGPDKGADIPVATEFTRNLHALLNAHGNDRRLWGNRYSGKLADRLKLQQQIIQEVPEKLRLSQVEADSQSLKFRFAKETKVHPQALMRVLAEREGAKFSPDGVLTIPLHGELWLETTWDLLRELG